MSGMLKAERRRCIEASAWGIKMEMIELWSKIVEVIVTMVWMLVEKKKTTRGIDGNKGLYIPFGLDDQYLGG